MPSKTLTLQSLSWHKWLLLTAGIALVTGSTSAAFLHALQYVGNVRDSHAQILWGLPFAGIAIVFLYQRYGKKSYKGNNLLFEEYYNPKGDIPLRMAPLVIITTLMTHLFGGSAGREGTAVQYGGTYADRIGRAFKLNKAQRRISLLCGVAAGFASLFGTPLAGVIFASEVFRVGKLRYQALIPAILSAYMAHGLCLLLKTPHTLYPQVSALPFNPKDILWVVLFAVAAGLVARLFVFSIIQFNSLFQKINNPYFRVVSGAILLLLIITLIGNTKHIGLGIPTIVESFQQPQSGADFLLKILLTCLTLSVGFKGGEVTPLFFIGATFASFLSLYIPLPLLLITALGFVSVFSGCTKTPLACAIMAAELFGIYVLPYALLCTFIAAIVAGRKGIYSSQKNRRFI